MLISLVIFFAICSKSWALPECEGSPQNGGSTYNWNNCIGTIIFPKGGKYIGEWKNGKRTGKGSITFDNGYKYFGEFFNDKSHGYGFYNRFGKSWAVKGTFSNHRKKDTKRITIHEFNKELGLYLRFRAL